MTSAVVVDAESNCSPLLTSLPVLPAPQILKRAYRGVRGHQPICHPLVDQGGVGRHRAQQHGKTSVQHMSYAVQETRRL
ncbi:hypothetical protein INR49_013942 [Caranx melampygus]|nr:hypothetical protein INR49_013942 [Caranx melampygus]